MKTNGYDDIGKENRLVKKLHETLKRYEPELNARYGTGLFPTARDIAVRHFTELVPKIPY